MTEDGRREGEWWHDETGGRVERCSREKKRWL